jgi:hypothetical protein
VAELCKTFFTNITSKDDNTREDAIVAIIGLAKQCSDQAAVSAVLNLCQG